MNSFVKAPGVRIIVLQPTRRAVREIMEIIKFSVYYLYMFIHYCILQ
jgi:hypothetical protein